MRHKFNPPICWMRQIDTDGNICDPEWHDIGMYDSKLLANRVLLSRRDLGWDQKQLSEESGVSRPYISQIERARKTNVSVDVLFSLAGALGVSVQYLLGLSDAPIVEPVGAVLRELAGESVTVDVDSEEERRLVRALLAEFVALPAGVQGIAVEMVKLLRQAVAPVPAPVEAMDEAEWNVWTGLLNRFDEPTRRAIERSVGIERDAAGAG